MSQARAGRQDYDYLIKLLLIGDSGKDMLEAWLRDRQHTGPGGEVLLSCCKQVLVRAACCCVFQKTHSPPASLPQLGKVDSARISCWLPPFSS